MESISIRELKNASEISRKCHRVNAPIFVTDEGRDDMVIMSAEVYHRMRFDSVYGKLMEAEQDIREGRVSNAMDSMARLRNRYGL